MTAPIIINIDTSTIQDLYRYVLSALTEYPRSREQELELEAPALLTLSGHCASTHHSAPKPTARSLLSLDHNQWMPPDLLNHVLSHYDRILVQSDDLGRLIELLRSNPETKRGVLSFWETPAGELGTEDPCLMYCLFRTTDEGLDLSAHFRGNDAVNKLLLNLDLMIGIHAYVAQMLGARVGTYIHHSDSIHVYKRDLETFRDCLSPASGHLSSPDLAY